MGTVARFDLGTGAHPPAAYVRATYAPQRVRQGDIAAGLSARPIGALPLRLYAEARATRTSGAVEIRPAAFVVSEVPPVTLGRRATAEGYLAAGWVGGRYATGFVDGQARFDRVVARIGAAKIAAGAGAWGGAQKFARRIDVGPTLSLDMRRGGVPVRLSLDYRLRVAGNARPGNGVAVTLSTGF